MSTIPSTPATPPGGAAFSPPPPGSMVDIRELAHPYEYSRLLLALTSTVIVFGAVVLWIVIVLPELAVPYLAPVVLAVLVLAATIWLAIQVHRARLLGGAILVSPATLPWLADTVQSVRTSLDYRRRVDVYVAEKASGTVSMFNFMGTRILLLDGGLVADLQEDAKRPQLVFLLGSKFGQLKARQRQFTILLAWLEGQEKLKYLHLVLAPYFRATTYSGDQIGAACCNDIQAAGAMMNRLLVGKELSPSLVMSGVLDQAARVRARWLPRFSQLAMDEPHLTNRYLNLMAFAAWKSPAAAQAYFDTLDPPTRQRLMSVIEDSPHRRAPARSRKTVQGAAAALVTAAALVFVGVLGTQARSVLLAAEDSSVVVEPTATSEPTTPEPTTPSAAEALLGHLPSSFAGRCQEVSEQDPGQALGLVAELSCSPVSGGPAKVYFLQYETVQALEQSFSYLTNGTQLPEGTCQAAIQGRGIFVQGDTTTGRYGCYATDAGESVYLWSDFQLGILGQVSDPSMSFGELSSWRITGAQLR